jgi:hypothetical protein
VSVIEGSWKVHVVSIQNPGVGSFRTTVIYYSTTGMASRFVPKLRSFRIQLYDYIMIVGL